MSDRRSFTHEFKACAVDLVISLGSSVISLGRSLADVSSFLGIKEGTLGNRVRRWRAEQLNAAPDEPGPVEWAKYEPLQAEIAALKRGERVPGKSQRLLSREAPLEDYFAFIWQKKAAFPVTWLCRQLGVPGLRTKGGSPQQNSHQPREDTPTSCRRLPRSSRTVPRHPSAIN